MFAAAGVWYQYVVLSYTLEETRLDFKASERPYVSIGNKEGTIGNFIIPKAGKAGIVLFFHNSGHLPALRFNVQLLPPGTSISHMARVLQDVNTGATGYIAGQKDISGDSDAASIVHDVIDPATMAIIKKGDQRAQLSGMFEYCDDFGNYTCRTFDVEYITESLNAFNLIRIQQCTYRYPSFPTLRPGEQLVPPCETPEEREQQEDQARTALYPPPPPATPTPMP
jgi:hypothetical protein